MSDLVKVLALFVPILGGLGVAFSKGYLYEAMFIILVGVIMGGLVWFGKQKADGEANCLEAKKACEDARSKLTADHKSLRQGMVLLTKLLENDRRGYGIRTNDVIPDVTPEEHMSATQTINLLTSRDATKHER